MNLVLNLLLIISGIVLVTAVMLMSPKGGIGFSIGGVSGGNEYGSKKTLEHTIKKVAYISGIIFVATCLLYPYLHG